MQEETFTVEDRRGAGFYQIDNELLTVYGKQLGPYGIAAYNALAWHISGPAGGGGGRKTCYPGYKRLAELTGMSRNGVMKGLEACRKAGIIEIITGRQDASGQANTVNTYILLPIKQGRGSPQQDKASPHEVLPSTPQVLGVVPGKNYPSTPQVPEEYPINKTHENKTGRGSTLDPQDRRQATNPPTPPPIKPDQQYQASKNINKPSSRQVEVPQAHTLPLPFSAVTSEVAAPASSSPALDLPDQVSRRGGAGHGQARDKPDANSQHPAVQAYRAAFSRYSNKETMALIAEKVSDLGVWGRVLGYWRVNGCNPTSVGKMVNRYENILSGEIGADDYEQRGNGYGQRGAVVEFPSKRKQLEQKPLAGADAGSPSAHGWREWRSREELEAI